MMDVPVRVRAATSSADLLVNIHERTTCQEVAPLLSSATSQDAPTPVYFEDRALAPAQPLLVAGVRAGSELSLAGPTPAPGVASGWQLAVIGGLDAGRTVPVKTEPVAIGRADDNDLVLADEHVSRRHAEVTLDASGAITIRDLGSANGTFIDASRISEAETAADGALIQLGGTLLTVRQRRLEPAQVNPAPFGLLRFNRPPRQRLTWEPPGLEIPEPPPAPTNSRLPLASMVAPLSAAPIYLISTHRIIGTFVVLMMSSLLSATAWFASRTAQTRKHRAQVRRYEDQCRAVSSRADDAVREEEHYRRACAPDLAILMETVQLPTAALWEVRPEDDDFLQIRLGVTDLPAATTVTVARAGLAQTLSESRTLRFVPFAVSLSRVVGFAGERAPVLAIARAALVGLLVRHSPSHVRICVLADEDGKSWDWLKWAPHCAMPGWSWSRRWAATNATQRHLRLEELLTLMRARRARMATGDRLVPGPAVVVLLDSSERLRADRRIAELLADGPRVGIFALCLATDASGLPAEARVVLTVTRRANGDVGATVADGAKTAQVELVDGLSVTSAEDTGRQLCPFFEVDSSSESLMTPIPPGRHLDALGLGAPSLREIQDRWQQAHPLACEVLVGRTESGNLVLNLARDVHWIVAGMTGSGKSELLRTVVAGLAAGQPPERLAFLFIDFKGNSAFRECERLPHSVGLLSNLDDHLAIRVLDAISIELTRRQRELDAAGFGSADEAWTAAWQAADVPLFPRLVVVVDELKELTDAYPEAAHRLNQVARIGRSLGVHLLLATQKPSRVAGFDELRSQVDVRISLRVADSVDSHDVIGAPDAAHLSRSAPGSGFLRNADARLVSFQGGSLSNPYDAGLATDGVSVRPFDLTQLGAPPPRRPPPESAPQQRRSDLDVLVEAIGSATAPRGTPERRRPWLPPLPSELSLDDPVIADRPVSGPLAAPIGLLDRLSEARQEPLVVDLDGVGNLLVVGGPGSGRTTLLETLMASLTRRVPPEALHCYGIEGRRHSLHWLAAVEHCGAVVGLDDPEHLERLTGFLVGELRRRAQLGAASRASEPHILLLCDAFEALADLAAHGDLGQQIGQLSALVGEGPGHGLHVVITVDSRSATARWLSSIDTRIVLRPNRRDDQLALGLPHRPGAPDMGPGRGYLLPGPVEVQIARGHYQHTAARARPTIGPTRPARLPVRVEPMPSAIGALQAEARRGRERPAGPVITPVVGGVDVGPLDVDMADGGTFIIGGPRRSGRSTALLACLTSLTLPSGAADVVVIAPRRSPLRAWAGAASILERPDTLVADLGQAMARKPAALAIDDAELLADHPVAGLLSDLVRAAFDGGLLVFVAGTTSEMCRRYSGWLHQARQGRAGLILHPSTPSDGELLELPLPRTVAAPARRLPGRGVLVVQGAWTSAQVIDQDVRIDQAATSPQPSANTHLARIGERNDL